MDVGEVKLKIRVLIENWEVCWNEAYYKPNSSWRKKIDYAYIYAIEYSEFEELYKSKIFFKIKI